MFSQFGFQTSTLQSEMSQATVSTVTLYNATVRAVRKQKHFSLDFQKIDFDDLAVISTVDASHGNLKNHGSQQGYLSFLGQKCIVSGKRGKINLCEGKSRKIRRVTRSSFASELLATSEAYDAATLLRLMLMELKFPDVDGSKLADHHEALTEVPMVVVTDARDVYDHLRKDTMSLPQNRSLALEVHVLRSWLELPESHIRWTATYNMPADPLTKAMLPTMLLDVLSRGTYCISLDSIVDTYRERFGPKKSKAAATPNE
jgi:hypothetical protein